jgi:hypothetical protein
MMGMVAECSVTVWFLKWYDNINDLDFRLQCKIAASAMRVRLFEALRFGVASLYK